MTSCFHIMGPTARRGIPKRREDGVRAEVTETTASILTIFCSTIKTSKYSLWVAHRGRNLLFTIALLPAVIGSLIRTGFRSVQTVRP